MFLPYLLWYLQECSPVAKMKSKLKLFGIECQRQSSRDVELATSTNIPEVPQYGTKILISSWTARYRVEMG
jgi:hypothetical protein